MRWVIALAAAGVIATSLRADDDTADEKTGLKVGMKAPAFKLKDQTGKERTLDEFRKTGTVAIVFLRSADL
jgi:cytochrome oxidase Cu insertion factor (SCO1/SenC/PrrC family)